MPFFNQIDNLAEFYDRLRELVSPWYVRYTSSNFARNFG